jgi:hypothetical protein
MRLSQLVCALALASWAALADEPASPQGAALQAIHSRSRRFSIPFSVEPAASAAQTVEVQLYVSTDGGREWRHYASVKPEARRFRFQANSDGPYWFLVRTKDANGQLRPQQASRAEMYVIVDTVGPVLGLEADADMAGTVHVRWDAQDLNLDPESFRLEYAPAGTTRWQPIAAEYADGQATFVPGDAGPITVRAAISDLAHNVSVKTVDVLGPLVARSEGAGGSGRTSSGASGAAAAATADTGWHPAAGQSMPDSSPAATAGRGQGQQGRGTPQGGAHQGSAEALAAAGEPAEATGDSAPPAMPEHFPEETPGQTRRGPGSARPAAGVPSPVEPPLGRQAGQPPPDGGQKPDAGTSSPREPYRLNTRRFALEYELESVGPSGVARVELWQTTDGGATWSLYGVDEDHTSPMLVEVEGEGNYGFVMVVESGAGLRGPQPQPGDEPEMSVTVDLTPPTARLLSVRPQWVQGPSGPGIELLLEWEAADERLAARPITLLAAEKPGGPWSMVRANLEHTGRLAWRLEGEPPGELFIRLEVRDAAGNLRSVDWPDPIYIERAQPKSRIQQVRPLKGASRGPRIYRFR